MFELYFLILFVGLILIGVGLAMSAVGLNGIMKERCWTQAMTADCLEKNMK